MSLCLVPTLCFQRCATRVEQLDRIYEDVRAAQSDEALAESEDAAESRMMDESATMKKKRVMMSPEPPQVHMFEESEQTLEERRQHWSSIEAEAQRLTTEGTQDEDSDAANDDSNASIERDRQTGDLVST